MSFTRILLAFLVSLITAFLLFWGIFWLACIISPPYTRDGYGLMPTGQIMLSLLLAALAGFTILYCLLRYFKRSSKQ